MEINLILADNNNGNIIRNLYPLYLYDLSEIYGNVPNEYGIYEEEPVKTLEEQYHIQDLWFKEPELLFPFIIYADGKPAGFVLVGRGKYIPKELNYYVYEFFVLRPYRNKKVGEKAAKQVFDKFHGKWGLFTNPTESNRKGQAFWRKTLNNYTLGNFQESFENTLKSDKLVFRFENY